MEYIIKIVNGKPFEHPIEKLNFLQAFPEINADNLPNEYAKFIRIDPPTIDTFEVYEGVTYDFVEGFWRDVHHVRSMNEIEKQELIQKLKNQKMPDGFIFDDVKNSWVKK